jgi:hypothetical protein
MGQHVRAALGPAGRVALVELVNQGLTFRQAAACVNVAPATRAPVVVALARRFAGRSVIRPVGV